MRRTIKTPIALEALFLSKSEQTELSYRASMRIAAYLGVDPEDRLSIRSTAKKSYNLRSRIVHGAQVKRPELEETAQETIDLLRIALRRSVASQADPSPGDLDDQLLA